MRITAVIERLWLFVIIVNTNRTNLHEYEELDFNNNQYCGFRHSDCGYG